MVLMFSIFLLGGFVVRHRFVSLFLVLVLLLGVCWCFLLLRRVLGRLCLRILVLLLCFRVFLLFLRLVFGVRGGRRLLFLGGVRFVRLLVSLLLLLFGLWLFLSPMEKSINFVINFLYISWLVVLVFILGFLWVYLCCFG